MGGQDDPEGALLSVALRGAPQAAADLTRVVGDVVWTACLRLGRPRAETEAAFREVMAAIRADGFARLKAYDGRARVRIYVALVVRDLLAERVVRGIALDGDKGWRAFQAFFDDDMRRIIARLYSTIKIGKTLTRPCVRRLSSTTCSVYGPIPVEAVRPAMFCM